MTKNKKATLGELGLRDLVDLGLRMPDGSTELFEVVNITDDCVTVMTKNIIDFVPFNERENEHSGNANSYAESSIRKYLVEIYQSVAKGNRQLLDNTIGANEFFLPTAFLLGLWGTVGWEAFKGDSSRIKFSSKYSAQKTGSSNFLEEPSCYWLSEPHESYGLGAYIVYADGSLNFDCVYSRNRGVTPALNLAPSASLVLREGVWSLTEDKTNIRHSNSGIKIGGWIEVTHTAEIDIQEGIQLGDCLEVTSVKANGDIIVKLPSAEIWCLLPKQVRKIESPLSYYKKTKAPTDLNERLKGYYQHTAIEALKVYHTAHKVKEERTKALNKVIENIQELIKLENE